MTDFSCRWGVNEDMPQMKDLWLNAFPEDTPDYVDEFLSLIDPPTCACCGFIGEKLVSMLFLVPAEILFEGKSLPVRYLYAGCTHKLWREHGFYGRLLSFAAEQAAFRGAIAIYLHPASENLFGFYERFGYQRGIDCTSYPPSKEIVQRYPYFRLSLPFEILFSQDLDEESVVGSGSGCVWLPLTQTDVLTHVMKDGAFTALLGD